MFTYTDKLCGTGSLKFYLQIKSTEVHLLVMLLFIGSAAPTSVGFDVLQDLEEGQHLHWYHSQLLQIQCPDLELRRWYICCVVWNTQQLLWVTLAKQRTAHLQLDVDILSNAKEEYMLWFVLCRSFYLDWMKFNEKCHYLNLDLRTPNALSTTTRVLQCAEL